MLGSISLQTLGGTGSYSYLWNNGSTLSGLTGLTPGVYAVQVTDVNGCSATQDFVIENTTPLILNNNNQIALCNEELDCYQPTLSRVYLISGTIMVCL
ncbi:MAG: SprB repeat-containing protein [Bacteroidetes bacterium]|nr:SprB repeat-containing protein [Bacteroidota bacterium]